MTVESNLIDDTQITYTKQEEKNKYSNTSATKTNQLSSNQTTKVCR